MKILTILPIQLLAFRTYEGYEEKRSSTFIVHLSNRPEAVTAWNGEEKLHLTEAENLEIFEQSEPKKGEAIFFYDEHPMIRTYASEEEKILRAMVEKVQAEPKLYVKLATVDSQKEKQTVEILGFENTVCRMAEKENGALSVPQLTAAEEAKTSTSIGLCWTESKGASEYEMLVDGNLYGRCTFLYP